MTKNSSVIGIDMGGTKIAATHYGSDWSIEDSRSISTKAGRPFPEIVKDIASLVQDLRTETTVAIGIGVPGLVDHSTGSIVTLPNVAGAEGAHLAQILEKETGLRTALGNDAQCFTLAEALHGAGKGKNIVAGVSIGTGVGGGVVVDGKIFGGSHGWAGEFGHMLLRPRHPSEPNAETRGEVEEFFSGTALKKRCSAATDPSQLLDGAVCEFLHADVEREVGWLCVTLTHAFDPAIIVFGGSTGRALKAHLPAIEASLKDYMLPNLPHPALAIASLADAGTRGAALLTEKGRFLSSVR